MHTVTHTNTHTSLPSTPAHPHPHTRARAPPLPLHPSAPRRRLGETRRGAGGSQDRQSAIAQMHSTRATCPAAVQARRRRCVCLCLCVCVSLSLKLSQTLKVTHSLTHTLSQSLYALCSTNLVVTVTEKNHISFAVVKQKVLHNAF